MTTYVCIRATVVLSEKAWQTGLRWLRGDYLRILSPDGLDCYTVSRITERTMIAAEQSGGTAYDPTELAGAMRLTEAEIMMAVPIAGRASQYRGAYDEFESGSVLELETEEVADLNLESNRFTLNLDTVIHGVHELEGFPGSPPSKFFEATVVHSDSDERVPTDEVFGVIFPGGTAVMVDSAPTSDYTNRRIWAAIELKRANEVE